MKDLKTATLLFVSLALLLGGLYPAIVTVAATLLFPRQSQGSLITSEQGTLVGSTLIGQPFHADKYFWPRPSATSNFTYNATASGGSNLSVTNQDWTRQIGERVHALRQSGISGEIPADLATASASGLDPHISPEAAVLQISRVAKARGMSIDRLNDLVASQSEGRQFGIFGMPRVNVLTLNLALDREQP